MIEVKPLHPLLAGEVSGVDLRKPVDAATVQEIVAAADKYAVLVFHDQHIDDQQQIAVSGLLGPLDTTVRALRKDHKSRLGDLHLSDISNLDEKNRIMEREDRRRMNGLANRLWHTDSSFKRVPAKYSLLSARAIPPEGGETEFADLRAAYDALPEKKKAALEGLVAEHSIVYSRAQIGLEVKSEAHAERLKPVPHRLVLTDPLSGRKSLYLSSHIGAIQGWPVPEARAFIRDLIEHATQREFVYAHEWRVNDLVMWDNRTVMHRARRYRDLEEKRDLRRTSLKGVGLEVTPAQLAFA